jgi:hypothetical protein
LIRHRSTIDTRLPSMSEQLALATQRHALSAPTPEAGMRPEGVERHPEP